MWKLSIRKREGSLQYDDFKGCWKNVWRSWTIWDDTDVIGGGACL